MKTLLSVLLLTLFGTLTIKSAYKFGERHGIIFRWGSAWIGGHYSDYNQRWCINVLPCVTFWYTKKGGNTPEQYYK